MDTFGWLAKDNTGTVWEDKHFPQFPGGPTHWACFVKLLEEEGRWIDLFSMRHKTQWFAMYPHAEQYAFHYNVEVELGSTGTVSNTYAIGTAVHGKLATVRELNEDGITTITSYPKGQVKLMLPSPPRVDC